MRRFVILFLVVGCPAHAMSPGTAGDREFFLSQVTQEAAIYGVPPEVADAVAMVETGYRPGAIGSSGEIGIMQILPSTAQQLGFHGTLTELMEPAVNIHLAVQYLARAWAMSGGDICRALMKYRAGLGEEAISPLSAQYCSRAISWLMGTGSRLVSGAAGTPPANVSSDPYVITIGPSVPGNMPGSAPPAVQVGVMQAMPVEVASAPATRAPAHRRRAMAQRAAALQSYGDSHVVVIGDHATTSFDSGN